MRTRFSILALAFLLALSRPGIGGDQGPADKSTAFGNASIALPKGWVVRSASESGLMARAPTADKDEPLPGQRPPNEFYANINIQVSSVTGEVDVAAQQKKIESSFSNYRRVEEPTAVTLSGAKGITFGGTMVTMGVPVRARIYLVTIDGKLYAMGFSTLASRWSNYQPAIETSVKSFSVK